MTTLLFLGDSLTEGKIGASYVARIEAALDSTVRVVNAGINGDTTINLLRRISSDVLLHRPDIIVVQVGLNDLGTANSVPIQRLYYRLVKHVPLVLTPRIFAQSLRLLLQELRQQTNAKILLCTFTSLSEEADAPVQQFVDAYDYVLRAVAIQEGVGLIDLRAAFLEAIRADPRHSPPYTILTAVKDMLAVRWKSVTYATLTEQRGYRLFCDGVHLADAGADLVAETILPHLCTALFEQD